MQLKKEVEICIKKTSEKTAMEVVEQLKRQRIIKADGMSFYKKTELVLYNYEKLKLAVKQKDEDIEYIKDNGLPERSKSIVFYSTGGNVSAGDRYVELIEKYKLEKAETERDLARIENALDKVKNDKYFKIIELKYLNQEAKTDEEMAEILEKDQSTITRNKKRLINSIKTILFPESIKELM
jgi:hypothetical protein